MTQNPRTSTFSARTLWTLLDRTVRPNHGARCNAAEALREVRESRSCAEVAVLAAAAREAVAGAPPGAPVSSELGVRR